MSQESNESPDDEYFEKALRMVGADRQKYPNSEELAKYEKMILYLKNIKFAEVLNRLEKIGEPYPGNKQIAQLAEMVQELSDAQVRQAESDIGSTKIILRKEQRERELEATVQELQNTIQQLQQGQPAPESIDQEYISLLEGALNNALNGINPVVYKETQQIENPAERVDAFVKRYHELLGKIKQQIDKTKVLEKKSSDYAAGLETAKAEKSRLEKELEEKSLAIGRLAAFEKESSKYSAELEAAKAAKAKLEQELADAKAKSFDPSKHVTAEEHKHIISEKEQQLNEHYSGIVAEKCDEIAELQAAVSDLRGAEAGHMVEKGALSNEIAKKDAELKTANRFLNQVQGTIDAITEERDRAQRELTTLSGLEKLREYHKAFAAQLKTQPVLVNLLLKAANGMGKIRQDMSDPSKTMDLSENMDWLLLHIVDVLPRVYEWTDKEVKLAGEVDIAKANLMKVIDAVKEYLPESERKILDIRIQKAEQAESAIQAAQGTDKSQLEKPEPVSAIVSDMMRFANLQWHIDTEILAEAVLGQKKAEEYFAIKDQQKKEEWVQKNFNDLAEKCKKDAEAAAELKIADSLAAKESALQEKLAEAELDYKEKMISLFALFPRDIEADSTDGILAKQFVSLKGPKGDTQDLSVDNLRRTIEQALAQRAEYKQAAKTAEENLGKAHAVLGTISAELKQKEDYVKDLEESKLNLGQTIGEQAAQLAKNAKTLTQKEEDLAALNEKIQKLESGAGFTPTDYVLKTEHERILAEKEEEKRVLMKISEGHISKDEHFALVDAKADEVRGEYLPVVLDQKKQISDLKIRISELEKTLADKENTPGVLAAAFTDDATANELAGLRQQLEAAKANVYNPDVHMPKAEHAVALAARETELRNEYKPVVDDRDALKQEKSKIEEKIKEQEAVLKAKEDELDTAKQAFLEEKAKLAGDAAQKLADKENALRDEKVKSEQLSAELDKARAGTLNPADYVLKSEYDTVVAAAKASAEENMLALEQKGRELELANAAKLKADARDAKTKASLESLNKDIAQMQEEHGRLQKQNEDIKRDYERIKSFSSLVTELCSALGLTPEGVSFAEVDHALAEKEKIALEKKDAETRQRVDEKQIRINELEGILQGKISELEAANNRVVYDSSKHLTKEELASKLAEKEAAVNASYKPVLEEYETFKKACYELEDQLKEKSGALAAAENELTAKAEQERLLKEEQSRSASEIGRLGSELEAANNRVVYDSSKHMAKEELASKLAEKEAAVRAEYGQITAEIGTLKDKVSALEAQVNEQAEALTAKQAEAGQIKAELEEARKNTIDPASYVSNDIYTKDIGQLKTKVAEAEKAVADYKAKLNQKIVFAARQMAGLLEENRELQAKLKGLDGQSRD